MELTELREEIRECDEKIISLIAKRIKLAKEIGEVKTASGLPIRDPTVEKKVKKRYHDIGKASGLSEDTMEIISTALIEEAIRAENKVKDKKE